MRIKDRKRSIFALQWIAASFFMYLTFSQAQAGTVTLSAGDGLGNPGSTGNPVEIALNNVEDRTTGIQLDLCRVSTLTLSACETTDRTSGFFCSTIRNPSNTDCPGGQGDRILLLNLAGDFIEAGSGPILTLSYDVDAGAPAGVCEDLSFEDALLTSCIDNGSGGCTTGPALEDVILEAGEFCFGDPVTTTTTTSIIIFYRVTLSPSSATVDSGQSLQLTAKTTLNGEEIDGSYDWEIDPGSTIGSAIDGNGLFTAGDNTTGTEIQETVRVTDTDHANASATALITIKPRYIPAECEVRINPSSATVFSGDSLILSASTPGDGCMPGEYEWSVASVIGSTIGQNGSYTAGSNGTVSQVEDVVTAVDRANGDVAGEVTITVKGTGTIRNIAVLPSTVLGFSRMPRPCLLLLRGEGTAFNLRSGLAFDPEDDIIQLFHFGFGEVMFAFILLRADPQEGPVEVTVSTGEEVARGELVIALPASPQAGGI